MKCTETCLQECPVLNPLTEQGADLRKVQQIVEACGADIHDDCGAGQPIPVKKGDWERCDLHPQVADRVRAVATAIGAGVLKLE